VPADTIPSLNTRTDDLTAALINDAVTRLGNCPPKDVARSLQEAGVSFRTTVRIIADPASRRRSDLA
jgi:hypothetical protein